MPTLTKLFTVQEVSQHNTKDNCWVVIDGKVCDLTLYVENHPGGVDVILAVAGRDATEEFEDVGHTKTAKEIMGAFCIGELDVDTASPEITSKNQQKIKDLTKQYWAVPVAAVGISVVVGFLYMRKK